MDSFKAFFHLTPWTKAFVFITSRLVKDLQDELWCEYFLILAIEKQKEVKRRGKKIQYSGRVLSLLFPEINPGEGSEEAFTEYGFRETISQATIELAALLTDTFCCQGSSGFPDPRCKIAMEMPVLAPASLPFLVWNFPDEKEISFIYCTQSEELKKFLKKIAQVRKNKDIRFDTLT